MLGMNLSPMPGRVTGRRSGEAVVFGVSGVVLIYEYHRSKEAERQRQEDAREAGPNEAICHSFESARR